jgi:myo-inositol catabolism protein IolC
MTLPVRHPVYMLAIDHRQEWVEWCARHGLDHLRIREVKKLAADAFLLARRDSRYALESGVLLVDRQYGAEGFVRARAGGATVGTPAECDGVYPLEWIGPFDKILPGDFANVLVRQEPESSQETVDCQLARLLELHQWCSGVEKPLMIQVVVRSDLHGEAHARTLCEYIRMAYGRGVVPQYWVVDGLAASAAMHDIDNAVRERAGPRQVVFGDGAEIEEVAVWFESAQAVASTAGFAVGRTAYWEAGCEFLLGRLAADDAVHAIAANYRTVIELWRRTAPTRFS